MRTRPIERIRTWVRRRRTERADFEQRVRRARLAAAGLSEADAALAMHVTFDLWREHRPWRWLPVPAQLSLFGWVARREVAERVARMRR